MPSDTQLLWLLLPESVDALELHRLALAQGISIAPGPMFSAKRAFRNCIRLNYGHLWDERHEAALAALGVLAKTGRPGSDPRT